MPGPNLVSQLQKVKFPQRVHFLPVPCIKKILEFLTRFAQRFPVLHFLANWDDFWGPALRPGPKTSHFCHSTDGRGGVRDSEAQKCPPSPPPPTPGASSACRQAMTLPKALGEIQALSAQLAESQATAAAREVELRQSAGGPSLPSRLPPHPTCVRVLAEELGTVPDNLPLWGVPRRMA